MGTLRKMKIGMPKYLVTIFTTPTCTACKKWIPTLQAELKDVAGVDVVIKDVSENDDDNLMISSVPTSVLTTGGRYITQWNGCCLPSKILSEIEDFIESNV